MPQPKKNSQSPLKQTPPTKQPTPSHNPNYLKLKPEDQAKVEARKRLEEAKESRVDFETYITAEFGTYFGWEGVQAILNNEISLEFALSLLEGARKVWYGKVSDMAHAQFVATAAAGSGKQATSIFTKGMAGFHKASRVK